MLSFQLFQSNNINEKINMGQLKIYLFILYQLKEIFSDEIIFLMGFKLCFIVNYYEEKLVCIHNF